MLFNLFVVIDDFNNVVFKLFEEGVSLHFQEKVRFREYLEYFLME